MLGRSAEADVLIHMANVVPSTKVFEELLGSNRARELLFLVWVIAVCLIVGVLVWSTEMVEVARIRRERRRLQRAAALTAQRPSLWGVGVEERNLHSARR